MKRCPTCRRIFNDEALNFCRDDGARLLADVSSLDESPTRLINSIPLNREAQSTKNLKPQSQSITAGISGSIHPKTRYARSIDINIAYQVIGDGLPGKQLLFKSDDLTALFRSDRLTRMPPSCRRSVVSAVDTIFAPFTAGQKKIFDFSRIGVFTTTEFYQRNALALFLPSISEGVPYASLVSLPRY